MRPQRQRPFPPPERHASTNPSSSIPSSISDTKTHRGSGRDRTRSTGRRIFMDVEEPCPKRRKKSSGRQVALIDGIPDHVAEICLARVRDPSLLSAVCNRWRCLIYSPSFPPFLSLYALFAGSTEPVQPSGAARFKSFGPDRAAGTVRFMTFDPIRSKWYHLPPPPSDPPLHHLLRRHPSFISRNLPIQTVAAAGKLVLVAGSTCDLFPAFDRPVVFDPLTNRWSTGPSISAPRRWCAAGAHGGEVFVASGMGSHFSSTVARSIERWDLRRERSRWAWEKARDMKDGRFSRDAIDAVGWRGRILMVNVKGAVAAKEGALYNIEGDFWSDMPEGMVAGIRGPVAAMAEEELYAVDETKGSLRRYSEEREEWGDVVKSDERLIGARLMVAAGGKIGVVTGDGGIVMVDVTVVPAKVWTVETPPGLEVAAFHILPRMSIPSPFCC